MTNKTIYLIGGTSIANAAAARLEGEGHRVVVSVATALGEERAAQAGLETDAGRKNAAEIGRRAGELGAAAIVDCSHPFAEEASRQAKEAAGAAGLPYLRYCRAPSPLAAAADSIISTDSFEAAAESARAIGGPALLTLGTRHLELFVRAGVALTVRVLPLAGSIEECRRLGIAPAEIIAAWPPFTADFNRACLRRAGAATLVTKDSGREGGLELKLEAAAAEGVTAIVVSRPPQPDAIHDLETLAVRLTAALATRQARPESEPGPGA